MEELIKKIKDFNQICECYFWIEYYDRLGDRNGVKLYFEKIYNIYKAYRVNNLSSMVNIIEKEINNTQLYTSFDLCKNLIFMINSKLYNGSAFRKMYKDIIVKGIYNPNWNIGTSGEPFFTLLPVTPDLYEINLMVYKNSKLDWKILRNESDSFMTFVFRYLNSKNDQEKEYYFKIINLALNSPSIDLKSHDRYKSETKRVRYYDYRSIEDQIEEISDLKIKLLIKNRL